MKKILTSLALAASLAAPIEVEAKLLPLEEPNKIEYTKSTQKVELNEGYQQVQYKEDNNEVTDEDVEAFGVVMLLLLLVVVGIYFLPTTIAMMTGSSLTAAVFVVNLFLGFTGLGWIAALVMAVLPKQKNQTIYINQSSDATPNSTTTPRGVEKIKY